MPTILECRFRHRFTSAAKPGGTTGCPECRRDGRRTSVRVPVSARAAPSASSKAAASAHTDNGEAARLAAAWAAEAPAVTSWRLTPVQPSEYECEGCGGPMAWHSAHTALACLACPASITSPAAEARGMAHAEALTRRHARGGGELAVIDPDAEAKARAARVDLHRRREMLRQAAEKALTWCDADYEYPQDARLAAGLGATLRGYLPEIDRAPDTATLLAILGEIKAIRDGEEFAALVTAYKQQLERREAETERTQARRRAEERLQAELAEAEAIAEAEAKRAAAEARQLAAQQQQRRQLPAATPRTAPPPAYLTKNGYLLVAESLASMVSNRQARKKAEKAETERRERNGTCGWCDATAGRIYGISTNYQGAAVNPQYPNAKACPKHYDAADEWIQQQRQQWGFTAYYWELDAA